MSTQGYIQLSNSNASLTKKFRVVMGTLVKTRNRPATDNRTASGHADHQEGGHFWSWAMTLRVMAQETDGTYGLYTDLQTFLDYNNPNGTPNNKITLTDHQGNTFTVYLMSNVDFSNLTPDLDGANATYLIPIAMSEV
jgi:hypothetical protein